MFKDELQEIVDRQQRLLNRKTDEIAELQEQFDRSTVAYRTALRDMESKEVCWEDIGSVQYKESHSDCGLMELSALYPVLWTDAGKSNLLKTIVSNRNELPPKGLITISDAIGSEGFQNYPEEFNDIDDLHSTWSVMQCSFARELRNSGRLSASVVARNPNSGRLIRTWTIATDYGISYFDDQVGYLNEKTYLDFNAMLEEA